MKRGLSGIIPINTGTGVRGHLGSRHHRLRFWQKKGGGGGKGEGGGGEAARSAALKICTFQEKENKKNEIIWNFLIQFSIKRKHYHFFSTVYVSTQKIWKYFFLLFRLGGPFFRNLLHTGHASTQNIILILISKSRIHKFDNKPIHTSFQKV